MTIAPIKYLLMPNQEVVVSINVARGRSNWSSTELTIAFNGALSLSPVRQTIVQDGSAFAHAEFGARIPEIQTSVVDLDSLASVEWRLDDGRPMLRRFGRAIICREIDVYMEYRVKVLLEQIDFKASRLGGPGRPDVVAKRLSHPGIVIDVEVTVQDSYDIQKYGYDLQKYISYKGQKYAINRLLVVYASSELDPRLSVLLQKESRNDVTMMNMHQVCSLCEQVKQRVIDSDSAFAKIIRPGVSDIPADSSLGGCIPRPIKVNFSIDPGWKDKRLSRSLRAIPNVDRMILGSLLVELTDGGSEQIDQNRTPDCLEVLRLLGTIEGDVVTRRGQRLAEKYRGSPTLFLGQVLGLIYHELGGKIVVNHLEAVQRGLLDTHGRATLSAIHSGIAEALIDDGYCESKREAKTCSETILRWLQRGRVVGDWDSRRGYLAVNQDLMRQLDEFYGFDEGAIRDNSYAEEKL